RFATIVALPHARSLGAIRPWHEGCSCLSPWRNERKEFIMLYWAAVFFVIALVAAVFGFGGLAAGAAGIAKILFFAFLVLAVVSLLVGRRSSIYSSDLAASCRPGAGVRRLSVLGRGLRALRLRLRARARPRAAIAKGLELV